jgi:hypothetical protein
MTTTYDPERTIAELRAALLDREPSFREYNDVMVRAAGHAEGDHFADPRAREQAGLGAIIAAASLATVAQPGGEGMILNGVALFGLALVDSARAELGTARR